MTTAVFTGEPSGALRSPGALERDLRRRIGYLMLFRVVMITLVLGTTVVLNLASPEKLAQTHALWLFSIVTATYVLTLGYALVLPRVKKLDRFADAQLVGDLIMTTVLVHVTGGAQSGFTWFYLVSILGAAISRYRKGAIIVAATASALFAGVSILGWMKLLPVPSGQRILPWDVGAWAFLRQMALHGGAFAAVALLSMYLGQQLASAGERLERVRMRSADLAALHEHTIRCLSSGLVTVDTDGMILTCNDAADEILGLTGGSVGLPINAVLPELRGLLGEEAVRRAEVSTTRRGREMFLGISVSPLLDHREQAIGRVVNFQDLTELRRMENEVKRSERLAAVGGLAAAIAHEIRNPLASISGSIELLKSGVPPSGDDARLMEIVVREVDRLNTLITEFLEYARPRRPVKESTDLAELLGETTRVYAQDRSTKAAIALDVPEGLCASIDPAQIKQVAWNLIRNAAEAMPDGGEVLVRGRRDGEWAEIAVIDQGVGMTPEAQDRIFEPFFTTKSEGTGLGLPTVHRIVTEHGGTIQVESKAGAGTTVKVRLRILG